MVATIEISGPLFHWRGPAPFHFVRVTEEESELLHDLAPLVSYGWGMIPVAARIGSTEWTTSLWPKDGGYLLPVRDAVRRAEGIAIDDVVTATMTVTGS
jgi:hypothetical protein